MYLSRPPIVPATAEYRGGRALHRVDWQRVDAAPAEIQQKENLIPESAAVCADAGSFPSHVIGTLGFQIHLLSAHLSARRPARFWGRLGDGVPRQPPHRADFRSSDDAAYPRLDVARYQCLRHQTAVVSGPASVVPDLLSGQDLHRRRSQSEPRLLPEPVERLDGVGAGESGL